MYINILLLLHVSEAKWSNLNELIYLLRVLLSLIYFARLIVYIDHYVNGSACGAVFTVF